MRTITTATEFRSWLKKEFRSSKPLVRVPVSLLHNLDFFLAIFTANEGLVISNNRENWMGHFWAVLNDVRKNTHTVRASDSVVWFLAAIYGHAVTHKGVVELRSYVRIIRENLRLSRDDLAVLRFPRRVLRSSPRFDKRFKVRIRVPLSLNGRFRKD